MSMNPDMYPQAGPGEGHLWARSGKNVGRRYPVGPGEQMMGRSAHCQIEVEDDRASLQHAKLVQLDARLHIYDLGSTNGTYVNDQRIDEAELRDGDLIQIGETIFEYLSSEDRGITITLKGSTDSIVPSALREGARQMLNRERLGDMRGPPPPMHPSQFGGRPPPMSSLPMPVRDPRQPELPMLAPVEIPQLHAQPVYPNSVPLRPTGDDDEDEGPKITITDVLRKVRQVIAFFTPYWKSIAAMTIIGFALGAVSFYLAPPPRQATFQLALYPKSTENPMQTYTRVNVEFFRSAEINFKSPFLIKKTLQALGDQNVSLEKVDGIQQRLDFIRIGLGPAPNMPSNTYQGTFRAPDPEMAVKFLNQHLRVYLDQEIDKTLRVIKGEVDFLEKELASAQEELNKSEWELLNFKSKNIDALPDQARQYYSLIFDLERRASDLRAQRAAIGTSLTHDRSKLLSQDEMETSRIVVERPYDRQIQDTKAKIAEQAALQHGEAHPEVIRLKEQLKSLEQLAEEYDSSGRSRTSDYTRSQTFERTKDSVHELEKQRDVIAREAEHVQEQLLKARAVASKLPELEGQIADLQRRYDAAKTQHATLNDKLKAGKLQLDLERASASARYDVIKPPSIEFASMKKPLIMRVVMLGFVFMFIGLGLTAFRQLRGYLKKNLKELAIATAPDRT